MKESFLRKLQVVSSFALIVSAPLVADAAYENADAVRGKELWQKAGPDDAPPNSKAFSFNGYTYYVVPLNSVGSQAEASR